MKIKSGATRHVLLIGPFAIKVPRLTHYRAFLNGLLANLQEREFSTLEDARLCPVIASLPKAVIIVMRRTTPLRDEHWRRFRRLGKAWCEGLPAEFKREHFGMLGDLTVIVDYGS